MKSLPDPLLFLATDMENRRIARWEAYFFSRQRLSGTERFSPFLWNTLIPFHKLFQVFQNRRRRI